MDPDLRKSNISSRSSYFNIASAILHLLSLSCCAYLLVTLIHLKAEFKEQGNYHRSELSPHKNNPSESTQADKHSSKVDPDVQLNYEETHREKREVGQPGASGLSSGNDRSYSNSYQRFQDRGCRCRGPPGIPGRPGADGLTGANGIRGPLGPPGQPGQTGRMGRSGRNGAPGEKGKRGEQGYDGDEGAPGAPGQPGNAGRRGARGFDGAPGQSGSPGAPGEDDTGDVTYTRWGKTSCVDASRIYRGFVAGFANSGSQSLKCVPRTAQFSLDQASPGTPALILARFDFQGNNILTNSLDNTAVQCILCHAKISETYTVVGTNICLNSSTTAWRPAYSGFLMTATSSNNAADAICVDRNPNRSTQRTQPGAPRLTFVKSGKGPRTEDKIVPCAVCLKGL